MGHQRIATATAEFLDSPWARAISGAPRETVRAIAEAFFTGCYDELGLEPRLLDAETLREVVAGRLPAAFGRKDARIEHAPAIVEALIEHVATSSVMSQAFEVRRALPDAVRELVELVESGTNVPEAPSKQEPLVHRADKLGRNDPCFCGSGKKFKKCHGKAQ
jgi:uncharacterized protein YecA (UPF0149 family)